MEEIQIFPLTKNRGGQAWRWTTSSNPKERNGDPKIVWRYDTIWPLMNFLKYVKDVITLNNLFENQTEET